MKCVPYLKWFVLDGDGINLFIEIKASESERCPKVGLPSASQSGKKENELVKCKINFTSVLLHSLSV